MTAPTVTLRLLPERFAVCRMDAGRAHTVPADAGSLYSLTRTAEELSLVCPEHLAPDDATVERGWSTMVVAGPLDFALTGILASLVGPLADARISIFAVSTYDTDALLVKASNGTLSMSLSALFVGSSPNSVNTPVRARWGSRSTTKHPGVLADGGSFGAWSSAGQRLWM